MINAVADTIDFSPYAKKDEVAATYATITALENIYKVTVTGEGEEAVTTTSGVLADEIARAKAAEQKLSDDLALLINNPTEALDSVVEIIAHVNKNGTAVTGIIDRLDGHDTLLAGIGGENQPATVVAAIEAAKYTLPAATVAALGGIKSAADVDGKVATNKVYVDAEGNAEVKAFSTDNLVQGSLTLVFNGGSAKVEAEA
jgi:nitrogen regulatory protein PII